MSEFYESDRYYESDSDESSESEYDDFTCYYCNEDLDNDPGDSFHDTKPANPRWYCSTCMLHIHQSDIEVDSE